MVNFSEYWAIVCCAFSVQAMRAGHQPCVPITWLMGTAIGIELVSDLLQHHILSHFGVRPDWAKVNWKMSLRLVWIFFFVSLTYTFMASLRYYVHSSAAVDECSDHK